MYSQKFRLFHYFITLGSQDTKRLLSDTRNDLKGNAVGWTRTPNINSVR